jgi:hypothetical protein
LAARTPLASDNTFFELVVSFNAPFADLFFSAAAQIGVNSGSSIDYALLVNPNTVQRLKMDDLSTTTANARVVLTPEPASLFLFAV